MDKNLLKRALADSEEPTPGYMFRDITQWTFLDHTTQSRLVAALMEKLSPKMSVHVLAKTLRLIKHLCESGHADFQKEIQRNSETLKQFANYRGTNDPKYGDKLNEKVRISAKEAVDAAFAPRKETKINVTSEGSNSTYKEEKGGFSTGGRVTGSKSGDPHMADMPTTNKWEEHRLKGGGKVEEESAFVKAIKTGWETGFGLRQEGIKSNEQRMREELANNGNYQAIDLNQGFGGGAGNSGGESGGGWKFTDETSGASSTALPKETLRMLTPIQKEVEKLASYKNTPQRVELTQFVESVQAIIAQGDFSYEDLAEAMDAQLAQKHPWQSRLNVLCAVEVIAKAKYSESFNTYFTENPEDVQRNVHVVQASLKERAQKVLKILNIPERSTGAGTAQAQQTTTALNQGETFWSAPVAPAPSATEGADFDGMSEAVPRRKKTEKKDDKAPTLKKRAIAQSADDDSSWGTTASAPATQNPPPAQNAGWGDSWGATETTATAGGGWGTAPASGSSGWGSWGDTGATATAPPQATTVPAQAPAPNPKRASAIEDMDAFFGSAPLPAPQAPPPQKSSEPAPWDLPPPPAQSQPPSNPGFDPLSLPPRPVVQPVASAPAPTQGIPPQITQMMEMLNQQMQTIMATAANNPNAAAQVQMLMMQQQQLMQQMMAMQQGQRPTAPTVSPQQQQNQKRADDEFAFAAQQMRQQMAK